MSDKEPTREDLLAEVQQLRATMARHSLGISNDPRQSASLGGLFDALPEPALVLDAERRILAANQAARARLDISEPVGRFCHDVNLGGDKDCEACPCREALRTGRVQSAELAYRWARHGGAVRVTASPLGAEADQPRVLAVMRDVSQQFRDQAKLELQAELLQAVGQAIIATDPDGRVTYWNRAAEALFGWRSEEVTGRDIVELNLMPDQHEMGRAIMNRLSAGESWRGEVTLRRRDGGTFPALVTDSPVTDGDGRVQAIIGVTTDLTELRRIEQALTESERTHRLLAETASDVITRFDPDLRCRYASQAIHRVLGYQPGDFVGTEGLAYLHPEDQPKAKEAIETTFRDGRAGPVTIRLRHQDGRYLWMEVTGQIVRDDSGQPVEMICALRDVDDRVQAEEELRASRELLNETGKVARVGGWELRAGEDHVRWTETVSEIHDVPLGWRPTIQEAIDFYAPDQRDAVEQAVRRCWETGESFDYEAPLITSRGRSIWVRAIGRAERRDGRTERVFGTFQDITERKQAEQELRASEQKYRDLFETSRDGIVIAALDGRILEANPAYIKMLGYSLPELRAMTYPEYTPSRWHRMEEQIVRERVFGRGFSGLYEKEYIRKDGSTIPVELSAWLVRDEQGQPVRMWGICRDVSDRKAAEEEQEQLAKQIQHTQKLESLGVLAGGIAHDFNNLLAGVLGNANLAMMELSPVSPARTSVHEIEKAAQRAAELCRQMLAYSGKGRFVVEPIDISEVVREMAHMLDVSTSKKAVLKYRLSDNLPAVQADVTQVRQVVMNLITNASEAIGDRSGVITLTTGAMDCDQRYLESTYLHDHLDEGTYVTVEVADTGAGMDAETCSRIFEPFYTTKFAGRGLGLAAVLGIVRGHNGAIKVYSEPGQGTTVKILLPACDAAPRAIDEPGRSAEPWRGEGTILLADDEETVRAVGKRMLGKLGFEVLLAADGREALEIFRDRPDQIDCVLLDLTMPHLDGDQAFRELRRIRPDVRVVLTSGYNEQDVTQRFAGKRLAGFVQKPYSLSALSTVLRRVFTPDASSDET